MQRLSRRRRDQRGVTAVLVAVMLVALLGASALAVDVGSLWWDRKQLQNGADAGALAIAQACAKGEASCGTPDPTAQQFASGNKLQAAATDTTGVVVAKTASSVTVQTDAVRQHWFAPVLGFSSSEVSAKATARWGPAQVGAVMPLAFSICEYEKQTGGTLDVSGLPHDEATEPEIVIAFTKTSSTTCTGPSGNITPGGFAWLDAGTSCSATITVNGIVHVDPGKSISTHCTSADFVAMRNQVILVPLFSESGGTGNNAWYRVFGFAAFRLTGYKFPSMSWNCSGCGGGSALIKGKFVRYVDLASGLAATNPGPNLGIIAVELTNNP